MILKIEVTLSTGMDSKINELILETESIEFIDKDNNVIGLVSGGRLHVTNHTLVAVADKMINEQEVFDLTSKKEDV